jgi:hypothetical protein
VREKIAPERQAARRRRALGGERPSSLEDILIDGLGFDWKDRSAFQASLLDSQDPRAVWSAVFQINRVSGREERKMGWEGNALSPREIAADLDDVLRTVRHLRGSFAKLNPLFAEGWSRTPWGTPGNDDITHALAALLGVGDKDVSVFHLNEALHKIEPPLAVLHEAVHAAAAWGPSGGKGQGRRASRIPYHVAAIVAELFRNFGRAPTYPTGTSPFKRTLRAVFAAVGITASPEGPGKWAARGRKSAK